MRDYKPARSPSLTGQARRKKKNKRTTKSLTKRRSKSTSTKRKARSTTQKSSWVSRVLLFLGLIGVLLVVGIGLLQVNFAYLFPLENSQTWLLISDPDNPDATQLSLAYFSTQSKRVKIWPIEGDQLVNLLGGYGQYKLKSIYPLLQIEQKQAQFIRAAFSLALNQPIDEIIILPPEVQITTQSELAGQLRQAIWQRYQTTALWPNLLKIYFFTNQPGVTASLATHSWQQENNFNLLSLANKSLQQCSVAVINTTQTRGLANLVGQILSKTGILVTRTDSNGVSQNQTQVYYDPQASHCLAVAQQINKLNPSDLEIAVNADLTLEYRADVVFVLGPDFLFE